MSTDRAPAARAAPGELIDPCDPVKPNFRWQLGNVSWRECAAMRLLAADENWSIDELAMTFMVDRAHVTNHVYGHCTCAPEIVRHAERDR